MVKVLNHALIKHKLSIMREEKTSNYIFKQNLDEIAMLMAYEVTKDYPLKEKEIETPICKTTGYELDRDIGMYRDEETLIPHEYYAKFPKGLESAKVIVLDPMLATGGSADMAIQNIKDRGAKDIELVCLVGAPEGVKYIEEHHPDVKLTLAALDEKLNDKGYIVPGLGDAGDRLFGTN